MYMKQNNMINWYW